MNVFKNIFRRKLRTWLTIIGIVIGVCSVVIIGSVGNIGIYAINKELSSLGINGISITTDKAVTNISLDEKDLQSLQALQSVEQAVPVIVEYTKTQTRNQIADSLVWGIDAGAKQIFSLECKYGRLINKEDIAAKNNVCLVDEVYARKVYRRENIVGKNVQVLAGGIYQDFTVVGVVTSGGSITQGILNEFVPPFVYVPFSTLKDLTGKSGFSQIAVKLKEDGATQQQQLVQTLEHKNGLQDAYKAENLAQQKDKIDGVLCIVTTLLSCIAGISLIVAGLSIMTVMLMSVNERTREIGIKKSIGAGKKTILKEFLCEAMILSLVGSVIGSALGIIVVWIGCGLFSLPFIPPISLIAFCILFAVCIGAIFGVYPAVKAAKMNPVNALVNGI